MSLTCTKCSHPVRNYSGERLPPWCPHCGADLKPAAPVAVGVAAPTAAPAGNHVATSPHEEIKREAPVTPTLQPEHHPLLEPQPRVVWTRDYDDVTSAPPHEVFRKKLLWQVITLAFALVCLSAVAMAAF